MGITNSSTEYGSIAKFFHWFMALLIIGIWLVGWYMIDLSKTHPQKWFLYDNHKSFGILALSLVILRFSWKMTQKSPNPPFKSPMLNFFTEMAHYLLYLLMLCMPLSGWLMSQAGGHKVTFFYLFEIPSFIAKNPVWGKFFHSSHEIIAYVLLTIVILHIIAGLYHHFILKDNTLRRITVGN